MTTLPQSSQTEIQRFVRRGELARATSVLLKQVEMRGSDAHSQNDIADLVHLYVKQSRYREAFQYAKKIEKHLRVRKIPHGFTLFFAHLISIFQRWAPPLICRVVKAGLCRLYGVRDCPTELKSIEALLWGYYWQDMRSALKLNLCSFLAARSPVEILRAEALMNYTLAFMGFASVGLSGLMQNIETIKTTTYPSLQKSDLLVWLAVAQQMNARPWECLANHIELRKISGSEAFYQIISYASQLNMSISELGPLETAVAAEESFNASIALKESRNHIQIYGSKAALLALEDRHEEAKIYLSRARQATDRNSNTLDEIIYHRLAAITYLNMGCSVEAWQCIHAGRRFLKKYAWVMAYLHEFNRLEAVARFQSKPNALSKVLAIACFTFKCFALPHRLLYAKTVRVSYQFFLQHSLSYWNADQKDKYFRSRISTLVNSHRPYAFERVALSLSGTLLDSDIFSDDHQPNEARLKTVVEKAFPGEEVLLISDLESCLNFIRQTYGVSGSFILNDESDSLRVPCADGRFLIAVQTAGDVHATKKFALGIIASNLEIGSHEPIEVALRVIMNLYLSSRMTWQARSEKIKNAERFALAGLATQVAHDIRSPLSALQVLASVATELSDDKKRLLQNAAGRISDIASTLLEKGRVATAGEAPFSFLALTSTNLFNLIESLISEKRLEYSNSIHVVISAVSNSPYSLFVNVDAAELSRVISNLVNNAVEALEGRGTVQISVERRDSFACIEVEDNGKGIPEAVLNRLGETGFSYGKSECIGSGYGLGLSYAMKFARAAGGDLSVSSQMRVGTKVVLRVPLAQSPAWFIPQINL